MTTKLIKELAGLCVEKGVFFQYDPDHKELVVETWSDVFFNGDIGVEGTLQQLQAAIERVKQL